MARKTFFKVQDFERLKGKLKPGRLRQVASEAEAVRVGAARAEKVAGVLVYEIAGDAAFDDWGEPRLIAQHGDTPET